MISFEQLRGFVAVVQHGGFSRAAEALGVGQSTVSFHVKALEESLGVRLLDRAGRSVKPTPAGRLLLARAKRILDLADALADTAHAEDSGETGTVRVAASTMPAEYLLPPRLARFQASHPRVRLTVDVSDSRRAARALLDEECDLAVVGARLAERRIEWAPFAHDEVVLVGLATGPRAAPRSLKREALADQPLILREPGSGTRGAIATLLGPDVTESTRAPRVEMGSTEAARRCALEGMGLTFISRTAVADDLAAGRLRIVRLPGTPERRTFYVGRLRTVTPPAAAMALYAEILGDRRGAKG